MNKKLFFLLIIAVSSLSVFSQEIKQKNILILYASQRGVPWYENINRILTQTLPQKTSYRLNFNIEHLDTVRYNSPEYKAQLFGLLKTKYQNKKYDLLITFEEGVDFVFNDAKKIFPDTPVIFASNRHDLSYLQSKKDFATGLFLKKDSDTYHKTADLLFKLHPGLKNIVVVSGTDSRSAEQNALAKPVFDLYQNKVNIRWLNNNSMGEILSAVSILPEDSVVFFNFLVRDSTGKDYVPAEASRLIAAASNRPVYSFIDTFINTGIVGGYMYSSETQAEKIASLSLKILNGEQTKNIPIEFYSYSYVFDWVQLKKWGINESSLPAGSRLYNKQLSFWELYKYRIIALFFLFIIQALLIIFLLMNVYRRKNAELKLKTNNDLLEIKVKERTNDLTRTNGLLSEEIAVRIKAEEMQNKLIEELQGAISEIKTLRGIFPICSSCKKIRDDDGYWNQIESYIRDHTDAEFSHSLCPDCVKILYPDLKLKKK